MLADMIERLLERHLDDGAQARARSGAWLPDIWSEVEAMGLPLALLSEEQGGFGLDPAEQGEALRLLGRHAVPLPVAETMGANRLLALAGLPLAEGAAGLARADHLTVTAGRLQGDVARVAWGDSLDCLALAVGNTLYRVPSAGWHVAEPGHALNFQPRPTLAIDWAIDASAPLPHCPMAEGATLVDPDTVWFAYDTVVGRDVLIEPNVFFGPGVTVADRAVIHANSHLTGSVLEAGAEIGPFARLRPGTRIGAGAKIGNFVEVKNAHFESGAKASHLAYIGDARVGAKANIGAGTIFCNYDGFFKHKTDVGAGAFIGSNSSLVAPLRIGDGAFVASGSVITKNVEANSLALARAVQESRPGWAAKFRALMASRKNKR